MKVYVIAQEISFYYGKILEVHSNLFNAEYRLEQLKERNIADRSEKNRGILFYEIIEKDMIDEVFIDYT